MLNKFEDILAQCIEDVKAGRASIDDCLAKYPSTRDRLEPLLRIALEIREAPDVKPSPWFKIRARVAVMEQIHAGQAVTKWPWSRFHAYLESLRYRRRFNMVSIIAAILLAVSALGGGAAHASQASLPGDALYPVKLGTEHVSMLFAEDDVARAERAMDSADRRVDEMTSLAENGRTEDLDATRNNYEHAVTTALALLESARAEGVSTEGISGLVAEATAQQLTVLETVRDMVSDMVPEEAKEAIDSAREVSLQGHQTALSALTQDNPLRAAEISTAAAEDRLNRAIAAAGREDVGEIENSLRQFGDMAGFEEILQTAQETGIDAAIVEERVAEATASYFSMLDEVGTQAPDQAGMASSVARARHTSMNTFQNALTALAQGDPARAMEINLAAMEERLNRAKAQVAEGNEEQVEDAVEQFEEMARFGEEISEIARRLGKDEAAVEDLVATATTIHLEVLGEVHDQVPDDEARAAIQRAMNVSSKGHETATPPASVPEVPVGPDDAAGNAETGEDQGEQEERSTPGPPSGVPSGSDGDSSAGDTGGAETGEDEGEQGDESTPGPAPDEPSGPDGDSSAGGTGGADTGEDQGEQGDQSTPGPPNGH